MFRKVIGLTLTGTAVAMISIGAVAKPPQPNGDPYEGCMGKQYYKFNAILLHNNDWSKDDSVCDNRGARIFFNEARGGPYKIVWTPEEEAKGFEIVDCDGTWDRTGAIDYSDGGKLKGNQDVFITAALHGPTDGFDFDCVRLEDGGATECLIGTGTLGRNIHTSINDRLFAEDLIDITWTMEGSWKVMDIRVFEDACD